MSIYVLTDLVTVGAETPCAGTTTGTETRENVLEKTPAFCDVLSNVRPLTGLVARNQSTSVLTSTS